jgi:hypothetical protein
MIYYIHYFNKYKYKQILINELEKYAVFCFIIHSDLIFIMHR